MDFSYIIFLIIIVSGLAGSSVAGYIHGKKVRNDKLVCPIGSNCEVVIYSKYSKFFGMPVENLGVFYYLIITFIYTIFLLFPHLNSDIFSFSILAITTIAFIFSVYLVYIQAVHLRQWCTWCLLSAILCTIIFISVWSITDLNIIEFINDSVQGFIFN